jgi:hypothetical protein
MSWEAFKKTLMSESRIKQPKPVKPNRWDDPRIILEKNRVKKDDIGDHYYRWLCAGLNPHHFNSPIYPCELMDEFYNDRGLYCAEPYDCNMCEIFRQLERSARWVCSECITRGMENIHGSPIMATAVNHRFYSSGNCFSCGEDTSFLLPYYLEVRCE